MSPSVPHLSWAYRNFNIFSRQVPTVPKQIEAYKIKFFFSFEREREREGGQKRMSCIPLYHPPFYSFKPGSLSEGEASKIQRLSRLCSLQCWGYRCL